MHFWPYFNVYWCNGRWNMIVYDLITGGMCCCCQCALIFSPIRNLPLHRRKLLIFVHKPDLVLLSKIQTLWSFWLSTSQTSMMIYSLKITPWKKSPIEAHVLAFLTVMRSWIHLNRYCTNILCCWTTRKWKQKQPRQVWDVGESHNLSLIFHTELLHLLGECALSKASTCFFK